jgi:hypothetical protein
MVAVPDVMEVIKSMDKYSTADYIRDSSFHERLLLASMIGRMRRPAWTGTTHALLYNMIGQFL